MPSANAPAASTAVPDLPPEPDQELIVGLNPGTNAGPKIADVFSDLESLRVPVNYGDGVPIIRKIAAITLTKRPVKGRFFSIHPQRRLERVPVLILDGGKEIFFVAPNMRERLCCQDTYRLANLYFGVRRPDDSPFVWVVPLPKESDRGSDWATSALECAGEALSGKWVKLLTVDGHYDWEIAVANWVPKWPDLSMQEILRLSFKGRVIDAETHPVVCELEGRE